MEMEKFTPERHVQIDDESYVRKEAKFISDFVKPEYLQRKAEIENSALSSLGIAKTRKLEKEHETRVNNDKEWFRVQFMKRLSESPEFKEKFESMCDDLANYFSEVINKLENHGKEVLSIFPHAVEVLKQKDPEHTIELVKGLGVVGFYGPYSPLGHVYHRLIVPADNMDAFLFCAGSDSEIQDVNRGFERMKEECTEELDRLEFLLENQPNTVWF